MKDDLGLAPLASDDWDDSLGHILQDTNGRPLNVHKLMAHHPRLLNAWWKFRNHSVAGGALGRRNAEFVILRVAVHMQSWYEWASHVERSLACDITLDEIERVKLGGDAPGWAPEERLLLNAVDELIDSYRLSEKSLSALKKHFDDKQVMDIIAIHGMYVILGCMCNTWDLELDKHVEEKLPAQVRDADSGFRS